MQELEDIYKELHPKILTFFFMKTSNQVVAEDLTQEVFYQALKGIHSFQGYATIQTWLFAIAKNILKKYYRSKRYKRNLEIMLTEEVKNEPMTPEDLYVMSEEAKEIMAQIQVLDDLPKEIIILRIYGELSFKEIAQLVEKTENYVRVTFHRAKVKIKTEMGRKNMKECPIVEDLLPLYHEGLLKPETTEWVEEHIKNCSACSSLASISSEPLLDDTIKPVVVDHEKMMAKVTSKLTLYQLIFVGISFFLAIRTVIANENFGFILPYFIVGLVTYLFYRKFRLVILIAFLPVFLWFLGSMMYSNFQQTDQDYSFIKMAFEITSGSFMMAGIHLLFAMLGAIVGWLFLKLREKGNE